MIILGIIIDPAKIILKPNSDNSNLISEQSQYVINTNWNGIQDENIINRWVLYFIEFQHADSLIAPDYLTALSAQLSDILTANAPISVLNPPEAGKMRINVHAVYEDHVYNKGRVIYRLLAPSTKYDIVNDLTSIPVPEVNNLTNLLIGAFQEYDADILNQSDNWQLWNGGIRNLMLFNTFLTIDSMVNIFKAGVRKNYDWNEPGESRIIRNLTATSYLASVYAYNTSNLNIQGCKLIQHVKSLQGIQLNSTDKNYDISYDTFKLT